MAIDRTRDNRASRLAGMPKTTGTLEPIPGRCGGQLTFTGTGPDNPKRWCANPPMKGKTRCRFHGGKAQHGLSNPAWKGGQRMQGGVPQRIVENYERLLKSDQLTSLRDEIAWQRAYYQDLQARSGDGSVVGKAVFQAITGVLDAFEHFRAAARPDTAPAARQSASEGLSAAMRQLADSRGPYQADAEVRQELRAMWQVLANLTDKESRQYERLYNMITSERAIALRVAEQTLFMEAMERFVTDRSTQVQIRRHVAAGFERLAGGRDRQTLDAGGGAGEPAASDLQTKD